MTSKGIATLIGFTLGLVILIYVMVLVTLTSENGHWNQLDRQIHQLQCEVKGTTKCR